MLQDDHEKSIEKTSTDSIKKPSEPTEVQGKPQTKAKPTDTQIVNSNQLMVFDYPPPLDVQGVRIEAPF